MQVLARIRGKLNSIRRRIVIAVSLVYLLSSAISAAWIYLEISHEVDELFDAEMVQQAKTLMALVSIADELPAKQLTVESVGAHSYEEKLWYRVENGEGEVVLQTRGNELVSATAFREGFFSITAEEVWHAFGLKAEDQDYRILLLQEDTFRSEIRMDLTLDTVIPVLVLLPLMLWLGWWTTNRNFASFTQLANALRNKPAHDYHPFEELKDTEEVALIKRALNRYMQRIEHSYLREKRFSADAAHELRTPLASLKVQLQNQFERAENEPQKQQFKALLASAERLVRLVESLLLLSRTDIPPETMTSVNVAGVARQVLADYYHKSEARAIGYHVQLPQRFEWCSDSTYLYLLLANLMDNAIKYAPAGTTIDMVYASGELSISNAVGEGHSMDVERLSERFYRGRQLDTDGSGLGLSIVDNLAAQLLLNVDFELQQHRFVARIHPYESP